MGSDGKAPYVPKDPPKSVWHRQWFNGIPITQAGVDRFWHPLGGRAIDYEDDDLVGDDSGY